MTENITNACRVLVVDDEEIVQSLVRDALEDEGHSVRTASNGSEAIEILNTEHIQLLITDIRMPGMDGIELTRLAREQNPGIGVVFITGYATLNSAKDAIKQGALDYVMKPFELSEIRQAVQNAVAKLQESAELSTDEQLTSLSDLSNVLFAAGDHRSLVVSSLKFAMMHQHCERGSILYWNEADQQYIILTIEHDKEAEHSLPAEPFQSFLQSDNLSLLTEPTIIAGRDEHPWWRVRPERSLEPYLFPAWFKPEQQMIAIPVMRAATMYGLMMLHISEDTTKVKHSDMSFLSIAASQLAISLENVSLLDETRRAYGRLKELQDETIQLEKMATRGEISAEIGHELNNFLGVVAGNVSLLEVHLNKQNFEKLDKYLSTVTTTIEKMKSFTANLMDLRPISSAKETVYFDKILSEVVDYLEPQKRFRNVQIEMPDELQSMPVTADVTQIQQLLYNLFNNAADATEGCDERRITVTSELLPHLDSFKFSIRDTGKGFDSEYLARAFHEKFTTKKTGHGFGLVVCKRIIDNHDGRLEIESSPGDGTCISIAFPIAEEIPEPSPVG